MGGARQLCIKEAVIIAKNVNRLHLLNNAASPTNNFGRPRPDGHQYTRYVRPAIVYQLATGKAI